jgi:predicted ester cyclase
MALDFSEIVQVWTRPIPEGPEALQAFGRFYADRLRVNGVEMTLAALVERARGTQRAFADLQATVLTQVDTPTHTTVVFRMRGRHVGTLTTPLGQIPATGKVVERQIIDVLGVRGGLIEEVWMVADELSALIQIGALSLSSPAAAR